MFRRCVVGMIVLGAMMAPGLAAAAPAPEPPAEPQDPAALAVLQNELVIRDENLDRQHHEIETLQNRIDDLDGQLSSARAAARESHQRHEALVALIHRLLWYSGAVLATLVLLALALLLVRRWRHAEKRPQMADEQPVVSDEPENDGTEEAPERTLAEQGAVNASTTVGLDDLDRLFVDMPQPAAAPCSGNPAERETRQ